MLQQLPPIIHERNINAILDRKQDIKQWYNGIWLALPTAYLDEPNYKSFTQQ